MAVFLGGTSTPYGVGNLGFYHALVTNHAIKSEKRWFSITPVGVSRIEKFFQRGFDCPF